VGSGFSCGIQETGKSGRRYIVTAAHNFVDSKKIEYREIHCYRKRKGDTIYSGKHQVEQVAIHPKYDGTAECGFDIAIGLLSEDLGGSQYDKNNYSMIGSKINSFMFEMDPKDL